jgi:tetratricopeptide (TPR) repeat protein
MRGVREAVRLLAGRWEAPAIIGAVVVTSAVLLQLRPGRSEVQFPAAMADIRTLLEAGQFYEATDAAATLLEVSPPLPADQRAALHQLLAAETYKRELERSIPNEQNAGMILGHVEEALRFGAPRTAEIELQGASANEWLGHTNEALDGYRAVLAADPTPEQTRIARKALVKLLEHRPDSSAERRAALLGLLEDPGTSASYLWWALQFAVQEALDENDTVRATDLLNRYAEPLKRSDLKGYYDYLWAWVHLAQGRVAQAEPLVRWVEAWLGETPIPDEMSEKGYLPAMNRALLGQIHLAEDRPQEALEAFEDASRLRSGVSLYVAVTIGRGEALQRLERDSAALAMYRDAVAQAGWLVDQAIRDQTPIMPSPDHLVGPSGVLRWREALIDLGQKRREQSRYADAIGYLSLALQLVPDREPEAQLAIIEPLADLHVRAAEMTDAEGDAETMGGHHRDAARLYEHAAGLIELDERRFATMLWSAGEHYDLAGLLADAQRTLRRFVEGRAFDPRYPEALLRLGQTLEAQGRFSEAIEWYRRVIEEFPKLREAARARFLMAGSYVALGDAFHPQAEETLRGLLLDDSIGPESDVFRDALHELCDLLYYHERQSEAISRLEDMLAYYPDDPDRFRTRFMLADSYRKSAMRLRDNPPAAADAAQARLTSRDRLRRAAELFDQLLEDARDRRELSDAEQLYERLAIFYRGDCLLELNEPETLEAAERSYRLAAARYAREPAALTAQVQLSNVYLRRGMLTEAARSLEHARWLLDSISDESFAQYDDGTDRAYWQNFLTRLTASHLFSDVFEAEQ